MPAKNIIYGEEARVKLKTGVDKLAKAVATTLGPKGGNVGIEKSWGAPQVVHDGVTVAKEVELEDKFENMGAQIVKEASSKTNDVAGDGTTTATILAQALVEEGLKVVSAGANPMTIRRGLEIATEVAIAEVKKISRKVSSKAERTQIATISAQKEEIGKLIADAMEKVGDAGVITIGESKGFDIELEYKEGMQFDRGYTSAYFVNDTERMEAAIDNPYILVTDAKIGRIEDLLPTLEKLVKVSKNIVIIADEVDGEALAALVLNKLKGIFNILAVKAPAFGEKRKAMLEDIATVTGASLISEDTGRDLKTVTLEDLGRAERVVSDKDSTTIIGGQGTPEDIVKRAMQIKAQLESATNSYDKDKLNERLAKLSGGVAVIKVGAATESEQHELRLRVEDAVNATKAAVEEGIVAGGGISYLKLTKAIDALDLEGEELVGATILKKALKKPITVLIQNSGGDAGEIMGEINRQALEQKNPNIGFNVMTMAYVDMVKEGIIDPAKVIRSAVQNAVSAATMIITTECLITEIPSGATPPNAL